MSYLGLDNSYLVINISLDCHQTEGRRTDGCGEKGEERLHRTQDQPQLGEGELTLSLSLTVSLQ